jgi:hypothetical protein
MATNYNPRIVTDGLIFSLDVANRKCISPLGCTGFNNAPQLVKNLVSQSDTIDSYNGVKLGNLSYYTIFAIDYPENTFGGDAASRNGITPGYNVRSGSKIRDYTRALNYTVWNEDTQNWISSSYFNGDRDSGHCYDSYSSTNPSAAGQVAKFVQDYNVIKQTFPRAVHIVAGSHRDSTHTSDQYNVLRDLGAPSNVDSIIGFSSPEWILVGKPGLGAGNAYGWAFQNYSTNPDQVAHLNFGLPIYGGTGNYLEFDGTDDYITTGFTRGTLGNYLSISVWYKYLGTSGRTYSAIIGGKESGAGTEFFIGKNTGNTNIGIQDGNYNGSFVTGSNAFDGNWHQLVYTYDNGTGKIYLDSVLKNTGSFTKCNDAEEIVIGGEIEGGGYHFEGHMSSVSFHNRVLTADEVQQNFNATRSKFGI